MSMDILQPPVDDETYLADTAWHLLEIAREIGGSEPEADASRLEDDLYGPTAR